MDALPPAPAGSSRRHAFARLGVCGVVGGVVLWFGCAAAAASAGDEGGELGDAAAAGAAGAADASRRLPEPSVATTATTDAGERVLPSVGPAAPSAASAMSGAAPGLAPGEPAPVDGVAVGDPVAQLVAPLSTAAHQIVVPLVAPLRPTIGTAVGMTIGGLAPSSLDSIVGTIGTIGTVGTTFPSFDLGYETWPTTDGVEGVAGVEGVEGLSDAERAAPFAVEPVLPAASGVDVVAPAPVPPPGAPLFAPSTSSSQPGSDGGVPSEATVAVSPAPGVDRAGSTGRPARPWPSSGTGETVRPHGSGPSPRAEDSVERNLRAAAAVEMVVVPPVGFRAGPSAGAAAGAWESCGSRPPFTPD